MAKYSNLYTRYTYKKHLFYLGTYILHYNHNYILYSQLVAPITYESSWLTRDKNWFSWVIQGLVPSTYLFTISEKNHFEKWLLIALKLKKGGRIPFGPKSVKYCVKIAGTSSHTLENLHTFWVMPFLALNGFKIVTDNIHLHVVVHYTISRNLLFSNSKNNKVE